MHGDTIVQLPHPRQLLKRGPVQKRGRAGGFHDRFAVRMASRCRYLIAAADVYCYLHMFRPDKSCCPDEPLACSVLTPHLTSSQVLVPARLFLMRSREAKYPQHVLSLVSTKLEYNAEARTIALPVVSMSYSTAQGVAWDASYVTTMFINDTWCYASMQAGKTYIFRAITDDDAADWVRRLEGSIGLRCASHGIHDELLHFRALSFFDGM